MDTLLSRTTPKERRELFDVTAARMGIGGRLVEKDFWVCWTLRRLFALSGIGEHLTFKGGTSLSKAFGLIARFSEDIDLIIERRWLGVPDAPPGSPLQWLKKIKRACRYNVRDVLYPSLHKELSTRLRDEKWNLEAPQQSDEDPRVLTFTYPSAFPLGIGGYVRAEVKMEFNARSEDEPAQEGIVTPYAAVEFPSVLPDAMTRLRCLAPERTLFEKATLLHEELYRPIAQGVRPRLSRHFSDVAEMIAKGVADRALLDLPLYARVVRHRAAFFANDWMGDYSTMLNGPLVLKPSGHRLPAWERDYALMTEMFFSEPAPFDTILNSADAFAAQLNALRGAKVYS